jgi:hypothetical protein
MSAQGATLGRRTAHMPLWPVAGLVVFAIAAGIGLWMIGQAPREAPATSSGVFESTTQVREQAAVPAIDPSMIHESTTGVRELGLPAVPALRPELVFESTTAVREGAASGITYVHGLENPGSYHEPITGRAGSPCPECR